MPFIQRAQVHTTTSDRLETTKNPAFRLPCLPISVEMRVYQCQEFFRGTGLLQKVDEPLVAFEEEATDDGRLNGFLFLTVLLLDLTEEILEQLQWKFPRCQGNKFRFTSLDNCAPFLPVAVFVAPVLPTGRPRQMRSAPRPIGGPLSPAAACSPDSLAGFSG